MLQEKPERRPKLIYYSKKTSFMHEIDLENVALPERTSPLTNCIIRNLGVVHQI